MQGKECLTEQEFDRWALKGDLPPAREAHLNQCDICRALGEQIAHFDPHAAARRVLTSDRHLTSTGKGLLAAGALSAVALLVLGVVTTREYVHERREAIAFSNSKAVALSTKLMEMERKATALDKELATVTLSANDRERIRPLMAALLTSDDGEDSAAGEIRVTEKGELIVLQYGDKEFTIKKGMEWPVALFKTASSNDDIVEVNIEGTAGRKTKALAVGALMESVPHNSNIRVVASRN
jgi:hypothetical protein